ncbi:Chitinase [Bertholletia excelsa]
MLSLLLLITMADDVFKKAESAPECLTVVAVNEGDTCSSIAQALNLTTNFFDSINPNLNCDSLFVGRWLCIEGSAN